MSALHNIEGLRAYCLSLPGTNESFPFDENILVFKVISKMFAATSLTEEGFRVNLKCDPERAIELREENENVLPGYHMNKKHWNTVMIDNSMSPELLKEMIDHSYELVAKRLTKSEKNLLAENE